MDPNCSGDKSSTKSDICFKNIGGLANHIKVLREVIIIPLLYGNVYHHFSIKAPKGVLFHGPPGTGKTLVAGALATELNKESSGKVTFYHRKGADVLTKWVGESEKQLRVLFEKAARTSPSVIFFDEIDGLAPQRSSRNDQVHSSVVATLLALMDGLDKTPGVVVIGATNRIDSLDPALRRPGRFDRELYFPLPNVSSRKEILQVHTSSWRHRPSDEFLRTLGDMTSGYCGSDLQALCTEAVLCCLKRNYPSIDQRPKIKIEINSLIVQENDFLNARLKIAPSTLRTCTTKIRRLSPFIQPLLQKQVDNIFGYLQVILPQFTRYCDAFLVGNDRFAGRLILKGTAQQGMHSHIVPALLQALEHLQCFVVDSPAKTDKTFSSATKNLPSILLLSRIDDWWRFMNDNSKLRFRSALEDLHAGLPILLIATCTAELPPSLHNYFYYNSSIVIKIENPTFEERKNFFAPLFFYDNSISVYSVWRKRNIVKVKTEENAARKNCSSEVKAPCRSKFVKSKAKHPGDSKKPLKHNNLHKIAMGRVTKRSDTAGTSGTSTLSKIHECLKKVFIFLQKFATSKLDQLLGDDLETEIENKPIKEEHVELLTSVTNLVDCRCIRRTTLGSNESLKTPTKQESKPTLITKPSTSLQEESECAKQAAIHDQRNLAEIYYLWERVSSVVSLGLPVGQLELLYDTILACIHVHQDSFQSVISGLKDTLTNFEATCQRQSNIIPEDLF